MESKHAWTKKSRSPKAKVQVRVAGGPLIIESEHLVLRAKDEGKSREEVDIKIDDNDLTNWAECAWEDQVF